MNIHTRSTSILTAPIIKCPYCVLLRFGNQVSTLWPTANGSHEDPIVHVSQHPGSRTSRTQQDDHPTCFTLAKRILLHLSLREWYLHVPGTHRPGQHAPLALPHNRPILWRWLQDKDPRHGESKFSEHGENASCRHVQQHALNIFCVSFCCPLLISFLWKKWRTSDFSESEKTHEEMLGVAWRGMGNKIMSSEPKHWMVFPSTVLENPKQHVFLVVSCSRLQFP